MLKAKICVVVAACAVSASAFAGGGPWGPGPIIHLKPIQAGVQPAPNLKPIQAGAQPDMGTRGGAGPHSVHGWSMVISAPR